MKVLTGQRGRKGHWVIRQRISALLMLLALASSLLPPGMMPGRDRDGLISVVLCTSDGLRTVLLDQQGQPVDENGPADEEQHTAAGLCAFASVLPLDLAKAPAPGLPAVAVRSAYRLPQPASATVKAQVRTASARAPPLALQQSLFI